MLGPSLLFSNPRDNPSCTRYFYKILTLGPCFKLPFSLPNPSGNPSCTRYCYNNVTLGSCFELQIHCGIPSLTRPWDLAVRNDCSNQDALLKTVFSIKVRAFHWEGCWKVLLILFLPLEREWLTDWLPLLNWTINDQDSDDDQKYKAGHCSAPSNLRS